MSRLPDPAGGIEVTAESVADLADQFASGEIVLVDCREDHEWQFNRIPHARLFPLSSFGEKAAALVADAKPVVVYCHHGMRSHRAASWLRAQGLEDSWSMAGGIQAWSERIDPAVPTY